MKRFIVFFFILWSICISAYSQATGFTEVKFGRYQIADSQWNVSACMYTTTCQINSTQPGTMYKIPWSSGQWAWQAGQYVQFVLSGISGYPYTAQVYNSNGTVAGIVGSGKIINMGVNANGRALFFFVGTDNNTGQLFSTNYGFTGNGGYSWTGTLNPTTSQVDSFAVSYGSSTPLAAGATYTPPPTGPTVSGGTITQTNAPSNQTITSGGSSTAGYTGTQQTRVNTWTNGSQSHNNMLYIEQTYGSNNNVTITQSGTKNRIDFILGGNGNTVNTTQTGSNYLKEEIPGWGNSITINQTNTLLTNYAETKIQGNGNTVNHTQNGPGNHVLFSTSTGDINTVNTTQSGTAGHYAETKLTGNFNNVKVDQFGSTQNKANIDLTNAGGPASIDLQQSGGKSFSIIQGCANPAGCTTVIRQ
jgi:hypothetical protein